jgi:hypothetical protein
MERAGRNVLTIVILVIVLLSSVYAEPPKMKMTTDIAESKEIDWEYQMAYQRGIEAINWAIPAVSMINFRQAYFDLGGGLNTVYYLSKPPTPKAEALTANNQTPYAVLVMSTKDGPVVLDIPPASDRTAIFGSAIDIWQVPVADIGPAGTDQGKGGKYLFLPPGYEGKVPDGYFPVPMETYNITVALRLIPVAGASFEEAAGYAMKINAYPLSQAKNPPEGKYIDKSDKHLPTLPVYDMSFYKDILTMLNQEPLLERDKVMGGMLASIGIEKGKPFHPQGKVNQALEQAVKDGKEYFNYLFNTPGYAFETRWPNRQWMDIRVPSEEGFVFDEGEYLMIDQRAAIFSFATFAPRRLGKASAYLMISRDANGALLSGERNYKLTVPADVPVRAFWSVIAYSMDTKAFIYNDLDKVGLSSYDAAILNVNTNGSIDIYFGKIAPAGLESNLIPTAGEDFFLLFRFYGPEEAFFDKSFVLPDIERVD